MNWKAQFGFSLSLLIPTVNNANSDVLRQIVQHGLKNSWGIKSQKLKLDQAENNRTSAWFGLLPTLSLSSGRTWTEEQSLVGDSVVDSYSAANTLRVSGAWTIWNNFQNVTDIRTSQIGLEIERASLARETQRYILNVVDSYLELQLLMRRLEIQKAFLEQSTKTRDESQTMVAIGAKTKLDAMDSEIQVANTERDVYETESSVLSAERNLRALINYEPERAIPSLDLLRDQPYYLPLFEKNIDDIRANWRERFNQAQPDLKISLLEIEKSSVSLFQTKLGYLPTVNLGVTHDINMDKHVQDEVSGRRVTLETTAIALTLTWQFWDWFSTHRGISNSQKDYDISRNSYMDSKQRTLAEIENLMEQYRILEKTVEVSRLVVEKAEIQQDYSREMFRMGRVTLLSMQQSSTRLFEARINLASRLKAKYILMAKILFNAGQDLDPNNPS